jgi:hypothetical protein
MLSTNDIVFGVVLPFVLASAILKLANMFASARSWPGPLAIGVAFTLAFACIEGFAHVLAPASAVPWLFYAGLFFTAIGLLDASGRRPAWLRAVVIFLTTAAAAAVILKFNFSNQTWNALHGALWLSGIGIVGVIWWACFEAVASEEGVVMPIAGMLISGIAGLVIMLVADQTVGQALGAMGMALAGAAAVVGWFGNISLARGTAAVIASVGICALAAAYFVSDVPILDLALVGVAPLLLAGSAWLPIRRRWLRAVMRLVIVMVPLGVALALAVAQFQREAAERSADPYSINSAPVSNVLDCACDAFHRCCARSDLA